MKKIFKSLLLGSSVFVAIGISITLILYPFIATLTENHFFGLLLMFLSSVTIRYLMILFYDYQKIDWLLLEMFKAKKEHRGNNLTRRIKKLKKIGNTFLFLFLIFTDPVIFVIYFRPDHDKWNGLENVKYLFILSNILCVLVAGNVMSVVGTYLKSWMI